MSRIVHLAGWGAVTGFGDGRAALLDGIYGGRTAIAPRSRTAGGPVPTDHASEVHGLEDVPDEDRALVIAARAAREALAASAVANVRAVALVLASTKGELTGIGIGPTADTGTGLGSPARLARRLADELGVERVLGAVSCACASGLVALALAGRRIASGEIERVLVVGVDVLDVFVLAGFGGLHALDRAPCRPFDRTRRGVTLGDGAAAMLLTVHEHESCGVRIAGWGGANDACHVTGPDRVGSGVALAGRRVLATARLGVEEIDLVHLHGTGTVANDACEAHGLVQLFGGATAPAFGTKGQTGHTLGAAGVLETGLLAEALSRGEVPSNHGLVEPDVEPRLHLVRERCSIGGAGVSRTGLKVSCGFGGIVSALVLRT